MHPLKKKQWCKVPNSTVEIWRHKILLVEYVIKTFFFQNCHEEFLPHVLVQYTSHNVFTKTEGAEHVLLEPSPRDIECGTVPFTFNHCVQIAAHTNPNIL
jgi:hypothetical protein